SFTQGDRQENIKQAAEDFMDENPGVTIEIESFSWDTFEKKWTTGLSSGNVPDISTALPNQAVEMINAEALLPLNDLVDDIGRDRFYDTDLEEMSFNGDIYAIPLYITAEVLWYRKDLLEEEGLTVPETWDELYETAKAINNQPDIYGFSVPMGSDDEVATKFLNHYVRSAGDTLLTEDGKANLTSDAAIEGIKYFKKMYKELSPEGSTNYNILDQATKFYEGKTAFDFNTGFHINGVKENSPQLLDSIEAAPIPKINKDDKREGTEKTSTPWVIWKNSEHPEIAKEFMKFMYEDDRYIDFLHSNPGGMLPAFEDIAKSEEFKDESTIQEFADSIEVTEKAAEIGSGIGLENGSVPDAGFLTSQGVIEKMLQEIVLKDVPVEEAAKNAENELNKKFEVIGN